MSSDKRENETVQGREEGRKRTGNEGREGAVEKEGERVRYIGVKTEKARQTRHKKTGQARRN